MMIKQIIPYITIVTLLVVTTVNSHDAAPIPRNAAQISSWFKANIKPFSARKGTLNASLVAAEATPKTIKVRKNGNGDFKTITEAIKSIPSGNKQRVIVDIGPGVYVEKITIKRDKPFITLFGSSGQPTLSFAGTARKYGTVYSATLQVDADYFVAANLVIKNTAPMPDGKTIGAQAVAYRIGGDKAAMYNCRFIGFQDTICDDRGRHFFKDCYIEGTVDFIFGSGRSLYLGTDINVLAETGMTVITAQAKHTRLEMSGYSFVHSKISGNGKGAILGRAWKEMPEVVFAYSSMTDVISPQGWSNHNHPEREKNMMFGEYKNTGVGANPAKRVKFSKQLTDSQVKPFISLGYIEGSSWLLPPPYIETYYHHHNICCKR